MPNPHDANTVPFSTRISPRLAKQMKKCLEKFETPSEYIRRLIEQDAQSPSKDQ
jgi:hypothetical protein